MTADADDARGYVSPKLTREMRQRLRWLVLASGSRVYARTYVWRSAVQSMLALGLVTWRPMNPHFGVLEITQPGKLALAIADAAQHRADTVEGTPRTKGPWA